MYNRFAKFFNADTNQIKKLDKKIIGISEELKELLKKFGGDTFSDGLYRVHKYEEIENWTSIVESAYPEFVGRIKCFGYDWLGRQFAIDNQRLKNSKEMILMFEPGTADVLEIPCDIIEFHEIEIVEFHDACLASSFFNHWRSSTNINFIEFEKCVGYKTPLFLGGQDTILNLELSDLDVYWTICSQLISRTK